MHLFDTAKRLAEFFKMKSALIRVSLKINLIMTLGLWSRRKFYL